MNLEIRNEIHHKLGWHRNYLSNGLKLMKRGKSPLKQLTYAKESTNRIKELVGQNLGKGIDYIGEDTFEMNDGTIFKVKSIAFYKNDERDYSKIIHYIRNCE